MAIILIFGPISDLEAYRERMVRSMLGNLARNVASSSAG